jgi:type IV secretory pathway VirB4 component
MLGRMTKEEDALVDNALIETYAKKDITPDTDLTKITPPTMQDFQDILEGMEGTEDIIPRIKKYTQGTFAGLFNELTNVDLDTGLVVFSIRDLEDELRPIAMYVVLNYIWNIVRSKLKRRMIVVDEAWWMMQYEDSARFMFSLAKRGRKYYVGLTTISQDVNDFLTSDYGKAIVTNSSMQLLLKQSPANIEILTKVFHLTEQEKYLLLESDVGEGIFFAGPKHVAIKIVASYSEDQIITTDPKQILEIEKAKDEFKESENINI